MQKNALIFFSMVDRFWNRLSIDTSSKFRENSDLSYRKKSLNL